MPKYDSQGRISNLNGRSGEQMVEDLLKRLQIPYKKGVHKFPSDLHPKGEKHDFLLDDCLVLEVKTYGPPEKSLDELEPYERKNINGTIWRRLS
jgi:hypothetical protein